MRNLQWGPLSVLTYFRPHTVYCRAQVPLHSVKPSSTPQTHKCLYNLRFKERSGGPLDEIVTILMVRRNIAPWRHFIRETRFHDVIVYICLILQLTEAAHCYIVFGISALTKFSTKFTSIEYFFRHWSSGLEPHIALLPLPTINQFYMPLPSGPVQTFINCGQLCSCMDLLILSFSSWKWHFPSIWLARKPKVTKIEAIWPFLIVSLWGPGTAGSASYLNFVVLSSAINTTWWLAV